MSPTTTPSIAASPSPSLPVDCAALVPSGGPLSRGGALV